MKEIAIPDSWQQGKLGSYLTLINGRAYKQEELLASGTPVIRIQNLNGGTNWYYSNLALPAEKYCDKGDLLFAWSASFGPYIWTGTRAIYHYHIWKVVPHRGVDRLYAYYYLLQLTQSAKNNAHGLAMLHITKQKMEELPFLLPPEYEQKKIVAKIESTSKKIKAIDSAVTQTESLLSKYKESLLAKAFRGQLVPQDPNDEPASKLLERIRAERAKAETGKKKKKDDLPPITEDEIPFEIPKSWEWVRLGELVSDTQLGLVKSSAEQFDKGSHYYLRMGDFDDTGKFDYSKVTKVNSTKEESEKFQVHEGDFLFNTRNSFKLVGKVCQIESDYPRPLLFNNNLMKISFCVGVHTRYMFWVFQSKCIRDQLTLVKSGTTSVAAIYGRDLFKVFIPVPPANEQQRIVSNLNENYGRFQNILKQTSELREKCIHLEGAILSAAFAGKLHGTIMNASPIRKE